MCLGLIPLVGSGSTHRKMEKLPYSCGLAIATLVLGVSFRFTADALSPDPVYITPYHSKNASIGSLARPGQIS